MYFLFNSSAKIFTVQNKRNIVWLQLLILAFVKTFVLFYVWLFEYRFFPHKKQQPLRIGATAFGIFSVCSIRTSYSLTVQCVYVCDCVYSQCMRICVLRCLCYTIGKMKESSGVWLNGWMDGCSLVVLFIFVLCARAKNGTLEIQIQCHSRHNTHIYTCKPRLQTEVSFHLAADCQSFDAWTCANQTNTLAAHCLHRTQQYDAFFFILVACDSGNWIIQSTCKPHSNRTHCITLILFYIIKLTQTACKWNFIYRIFCRHVRLNADTFASETCLFSNSLIIAPKFNLQALAVADSDPLSKTSSFFGVDAKLVCDVRLSDRLNVSRRFRSDDSDVDFLGELFVGLTTSSSLSARTYKLPIFSLIFCVFA